MSPFLVDSIGHNLGLGCRRSSNFFCYGLWTHSGLLGVRPAPKSICTHQAHPLKLLARKNGQIDLLWPKWNGAAWRPRWASEIKNGFKRVLWTLNHLLWCLDDVSHRLWKNIFALEKSSKVTFSPKSLLGLYSTKIQGFKGMPPEKLDFGTLFWGSITFYWRRVRSWYWYGIEVWYSTLFGPRPTPSMCTHQAHQPIFSICGFMVILGKFFSRHRIYQMRSYTRPWCSERCLKYLKCLFMHFWAKKFFENFTPKS